MKEVDPFRALLGGLGMFEDREQENRAALANIKQGREFLRKLPGGVKRGGGESWFENVSPGQPPCVLCVSCLVGLSLMLSDCPGHADGIKVRSESSEFRRAVGRGPSSSKRGHPETCDFRKIPIRESRQCRGRRVPFS